METTILETFLFTKRKSGNDKHSSIHNISANHAEIPSENDNTANTAANQDSSYCGSQALRKRNN